MNEQLIADMFRAQLFNITVLQIIVPTCCAGEQEIEMFRDNFRLKLPSLPNKL